MQKRFYLQQIFKCLLSKMDEKSVRTTLPDFFLFFVNQIVRRARQFKDSGRYHKSGQWYKDKNEF